MSRARGAVASVPVTLRQWSRRVADARSARTAPSGGCHAPSASLYLHQSGDVRACCQNWWLPLGNVTSARLSDIWKGERAERLRQAIAADDYSLGCEFCQWQQADGAGSTVYARQFDHLAAGGRHSPAAAAWPEQIEFAMSNTCNLQCVMCNGEWSSSIRAQREHLPPLPKAYDDRFFDDLAEFLPHLRYAKFLGGEPFLARESLRVFDMLIDGGLRPATWITTNGTIWNERVERVLAGLQPNLVVSIDAFSADAYEAIRIGARYDEVVANVDRFRAATAGSGATTSVAYCLMASNWRSLPDLFRFAGRRDLGVSINTVLHPEADSVFTMAEADLATVVRTLEAEHESVHREAPSLAAQWDDQLDRLRRHLGALAARSGTAGLVYEAARHHHRFEPVHTGGESCAEVEAEVAAWASGGWVRLEVGPDGLVTGGRDEGLGAGVDLVALTTGLGVAQVEEMFVPSTAREAVSFGEAHDDRWDRVLSMDGDDDSVVRVVLAPARDEEGVAHGLVLWVARQVRPDLTAEPPPRYTAFRPHEAELLDVLRAWGGPDMPIHRLDADADEVIVSASAEPDELLGSLAELVGRPVGAVQTFLEQRLGSPFTPAVELAFDGQPVLVRCESVGRSTTVRIAVHSALDGSLATLFVGARAAVTGTSPV